jgi:tRNA modification GTPase
VINKNDLPLKLDLGRLRNEFGDRELISVSAQREDGLHELKVALRNLILGTETEPTIVLTNIRHQAALTRAEESLFEVFSCVQANQPAEVIAVGLQEAKAALEEIIGVIKSSDILERIFTNFCIGK